MSPLRGLLFLWWYIVGILREPWKGEIIKRSPKGIRKIRLFLPLIFCCLFIGRCFYLALFTPKSAQKAQRRQNTVVAPFCSRIFDGRKYCLRRTSAALAYNCKLSLHCARWHELCFVCCSLVSNFPRRKTPRECASYVAQGAPKKTCTLLSAP